MKTITFEGCSRAGFYAELGHTIVKPLVEQIVWSFKHNEAPQFQLDFSRSWPNYQERDRVSIYDQIFKEDTSVQLILPYYGVKQDHWTLIPRSDFTCLNAVFGRYFSQSASQVLLKDQLVRKYGITPSRTLAVCYRGTDKYKEVPLVDVKRYVTLIDSIMSAHSDLHRILIQTDQQQVRDLLVDTFKTQAFYLDEMPVTDGSTAIHTLIDKSQRVSFAKTLDCSVRIMADCHSVVTSLSNMSWAIGAYRNDSQNVYQFSRNGRVVTAPAGGQHVGPGRSQLFADVERWFDGVRAWRRRS